MTNAMSALFALNPFTEVKTDSAKKLPVVAFLKKSDFKPIKKPAKRSAKK
jgi:hypothetical protein